MGIVKNVQRLRIGSEDLVVLRRKEFDALLKRAESKEIDEDAGTVRVIARSEADLRAGRVGTIPGEVVHAIVRGKNPLRTVREWRGLTQKQLGDEKTSVGQSEVSALEAGRRKGTAAAWKQLAKALNVPMDILVPE